MGGAVIPVEGDGIVVLAAILASMGILGALLPRLLRTVPRPRSEADVAHDRAAEALRRAEEERGRDYADQMAAEEAAEIGDAVGMPTETEAERKARLDRLIWGDRKRRQR